MELDINEKINLRGLLSAWVRITVERHQADVDSKIYGRLGTRTTKKGVMRSSLSSRYRFGSASKRTYGLRNNWRSSVSGSADSPETQYSFPLYGRFMELGVGRGTDFALARYQGIKKNGEPRTRRPVRWYSRQKGHQLHRLRELLARYYVSVPIETLERALTTSIEMGI